MKVAYISALLSRVYVLIIFFLSLYADFEACLIYRLGFHGALLTYRVNDAALSRARARDVTSFGLS